MPLETNLGTSPYFDDFETSAKQKNYHKVLFKPGLAVQTRELNTIQSMSQNQIERFADNIFVEGTIVDGCSFQYDANVAFIKLRDNDSGGNTVTVSVFANSILQGATTGVRAKIITVEAGAEATAPNYNTLLVKYIDGGTSKTNKTFGLNEELIYKVTDGGTGQRANTISASAFGFGSIFSVGQGIIYAKGNFINVAPQTLILEKYNTIPSYKVGFKVVESVVTSTTDSTLLDNASGSFNYTAPGADRLKLVPTLVKKLLTDTANTEAFTPIFEVENGNIKIIRDTSIYDNLGRELAKRTYEESGNYMLRQINTQVKEHFNTGTNYGRYTTGQGGDKTKLAIGVEPGIAYIMGYRNETLATDFITADKATDTRHEAGVNVTTNFGNYVIVNQVVGPWDPTTYQSISLRNAAATAISGGVALGAGAAPGSEIGTAKLRGLQYQSGTMGKKNGTFRLYLIDIQMTSSGTTFSDVKSLYVNNTSGPDNFADTVLESGLCVLKEPDFNRNIYSLGVRATKQLTTNNSVINANYQFRDKSTVSFNTSGTGTLTISSPHAGGTEEFPFGTGALNSTQKQTFIVVAQATAQTASITGTATYSTNTITGSGTSFLTNFTVGDYLSLKDGSSGNASPTTRIISIANSTSLVVNPKPSNVDGTLAAEVFKIFPSGYVFDLTANGTTGTARTATVSSTTQASIDLKETFANSTNMTVFFNSKRETAEPIGKTVRKSRFVRLNINTHTNTTTGPWDLGVADVYKLRNVYIGTTYSILNRNVVNDFRILRNTNDNLYKHSQLSLKENSSLTLTTAHRLVVEFDYFEHDRSGGIGFFSVDSYVIDPNESTSNTTAIVTAEIPRFISTASRKIYDLRDSIDFRPRVTSAANTNVTTVAGSAVNPVASTTIEVDSDGSYVPVPDATFTSDVVYYLPRIDRVIMGKDGKKKVIRGIPNDKPFPPVEPAESMSLSLLMIPPYPSLSLENSYNFTDPQTNGARVDLAVRVKPFFHKRYTMSDIAGIESRIDRLEYYTALNVLEKAAKDLTIPDSNGLDRFKNGIFVDAFFGHNNADTTDPSYNIAIDTSVGELRPRFDQQNIEIQFLDSLSSNVSKKGKQTRLDVSGNTVSYTNDDIVYLGASLGAATGAGTVRTVVANSSIVRLYLHNANGTFTAAASLKKNGSAGLSTISSVQSATAGDLVTLPYIHSIYIDQPWASRTINPVGELSFNWVGNLTLDPEADHWVDTTSQPDVQWSLDLASNWQTLGNAWGTQWNEWNTESTSTDRERKGTAFTINGTGSLTLGDDREPAHGAIDDVLITTTEEQIRSGTRLNVSTFERTQQSGPFLTRTDIVPFMRSREVRFAATGLRPNTRVYPYFDDILVNDYVVPANSSFSNTGSLGGSLNTDTNGSVYGVFIIPNDNTLKFRLGERPFKLIDIANTVTQIGTETTSATKNFTALGLASSQRGITFNTREASISSDTTTERRKVISTFEGVQAHKDPVAQTFKVGDFEFNNLDFADTKFGLGADGVFISCIDLYFSQKSSTAGISIELREVINGTITAIRVPFGFKRIISADVNVSTDGTKPTPFYFDQPVYIRGDKEYAFVVKPDGSNPDYRLWIAQLGDTDVATGALIDQQPAVGMLFTSANDRTYTPRQNQDVQFTIWRATFKNNLTGTVVYTNENDEYLNASQFSSTLFNIGEKIRGENIVKLFTNAAAVAVNDTINLGANTGKIRKLISSSPVIFKSDIKGTIANGTTITFTNGSGSFTGVVNSVTTNTTTGFIQFSDSSRGSIIANGSSGNFTSNTTAFNGFYRGQVSNASAQVTSVRDYKYDVLVPKISFAKYVDTSISWAANTTANNYNLSQQQTSIEPFENNEFVSGEKIIATRTNEVASTGGAKTLRITGTLTSSTDRLSPVVDIGRTKSVATIHNIINNSNSGETGNYGDAQARYITKKIVLADGQEGEDIKVYLSAYKPGSTDIDVYARIQNGEDSDDFRDKQYTKLTQLSAANTLSSTVNKNNFVELEYGLPTTNATAISAYKFSGNNGVVRYYNSSVAYFDTFKYFSLKIVLRTSTGSHLIPRVKDLRAIALQI